MKIIKLSDVGQKSLEEFAANVLTGATRPGLYLGFANDGSPVLTVAEMTWKEIAHLKFALDMHLVRDYLGIEER